MYKYLVIVFIISSVSIAQVPTQTEILKEGIKQYFKDAPYKTGEYVLARLGINHYGYYANNKRNGHHYVNDKSKSSFYQTLKSRQKRMIPSYDFAFPFLNDEESFQELLKVEFGLCAGVTWVLRNFNLLSFYRPDQEMLTDKANKQIIDDILSGKPRIIPGYKNLRHFLTNDSNLLYMKKHVIISWQQINSKILQSALIMSTVKRSQSIKETRKVINALSERLDMYHSPVIFMSKPNEKLFSKEQWIHVVQVHKIEKLSGYENYNIHIWDVNYHYPLSDQIIEIRNGEASYEYEKLAKFGELHFDKHFVGKAVKNLKKFCKKNIKDGVSICVNEPTYDDCTNYDDIKSQDQDIEIIEIEEL